MLSVLLNSPLSTSTPPHLIAHIAATPSNQNDFRNTLYGMCHYTLDEKLLANTVPHSWCSEVDPMGQPPSTRS